MAGKIPLNCNICPKKPKFSDVSHLLTHIASKGHLSHYYKVRVRSGSDGEAREVIEAYDQWYAEWRVEDLMADRMAAKDNKNRAPKPRSTGTTKHHHLNPLTHANLGAASKGLTTRSGSESTAPRPSTARSRSNTQRAALNRIRENPMQHPTQSKQTSHGFLASEETPMFDNDNKEVYQMQSMGPPPPPGSYPPGMMRSLQGQFVSIPDNLLLRNSDLPIASRRSVDSNRRDSFITSVLDQGQDQFQPRTPFAYPEPPQNSIYNSGPLSSVPPSTPQSSNHRMATCPSTPPDEPDEWTDTGSLRRTKLKGKTYPGMDVFDGAFNKQRRQRNQKVRFMFHPESVIRYLTDKTIRRIQSS
jgi:hypothetical protein